MGRKGIRDRAQAGFTLIEMLVVAPIVILAIGAFLTVIISMTGEVISSRAANTLTYNIQDALARIEQDVKLSSGFLAETDTNLTGAGGNTLQTGQGPNNSTSPFRNVSSGANNLILNMIATNGNPLSVTSSYVYLLNQPDPCATPQANIPLSYNVVYFVENGTMWRRVVMPQSYNNTTTTVCAVPWQRPSCNPDFIVSPGNAFCAAEDIRLVEGVTSFSTQYLNGASGDTPIAAALIEGTNSAGDIAARNTALQAATTLSVTIASTQTAAGREVSQASSLRVSRLDINASSIAAIPSPTIPSAPTVSVTTAPGAKAVFSWPAVNGATGYTFQYSFNSGIDWIVGFTNQNIRTFTVDAPHNGASVLTRTFARNSAGTSAEASRGVTIPLWEPLVLSDGWSNLEGGASRAAYSKTSAGIVVVKGVIKRTGTFTVGETVATLPIGFRPGGNIMFGGTASPNVTSRIDVNTAGNIQLSIGNSATWSSLDTIRFVAADALTFTNATPLQSGWTNFGSGWQPASYAQDSSSRVWLQGLLTPGTNTDGTQIFALPVGMPAAQYHHIATRAATFSAIGVSATGIQTKGYGTSYFSVTSMYYPTTTGWTSITPVSPWVTYSGFTTPQYIKNADGIVSLKGFIRSGSTTAGTVLIRLPSGQNLWPRERLVYTTVSNNAHSRINILANGGITIETGNATWLSLDGIHFIGEQ